MRWFQPEKLTIKNLLAGLNFNLKLQNTSFETVSRLDQIFTGNYSSKTKQSLLRSPHISANTVNHLAADKHLFHVRGNVPDDSGIWGKRLLNSIILKTLAALLNVRLAGPKVRFLLKYYFLLVELKCCKAPAYTLQVLCKTNWLEILQTNPKQFAVGPHHKQSHVWKLFLWQKL